MGLLRRSSPAESLKNKITAINNPSVDSALFTTTRLKIRNLRASDLDAFHLYRSNPEVTKYQGFDTFNKDQAKTFIEEHKNKLHIFPGEWIQYGIENISSHQLIGDCAIYLHLSD